MMPMFRPVAAITATLAEHAPAGTGYLYEFKAFTWFHVVVAGVLLGLSVCVSLLGRRWRGQRRERAMASFIAGFIFGRQVVEILWYLMPSRFTWALSLPLQFCDIAPWIAAIALLTEARWARILLYYWGTALCTQAFFTPTLSEGLAHTRFWWFWLGHTHIVGAAIYDLVARGFRPTWRDLRFAVISTGVLTFSLVALDAITGLNYGYVGPGSPTVRTIIDAIGPYPQRVLVLICIVFTAFVILTAVWRPSSRRGGPDPRPDAN